MNQQEGRQQEPGAPFCVQTPVLVLGYGNTLRGDDGAGPRAADLIAEWDLPGVSVIVAHQLTPELSEPIARAASVLFIDASADTGAGGVSISPVGASAPAGSLGHAQDPAALLAMASALFGGRAEAWLIALPASTFEFGEHLSERAEAGVREALEVLRPALQAAAEHAAPPNA